MAVIATYISFMNLIELAQRIRKLRQERNLTLEEAASRSNLTRSWLSKVENFRVTPSLPALAAIAAALDVSVAQLVDGLDEKEPIVVIRKNERLMVERDRDNLSKIVYESLAHKHVGRVMDPFLLTVPSNEMNREPMSHEGEEFMIVLKGRVLFEYDDEKFDLRAGDSLYFDATGRHRILNPNKSPAEVLSVFLASRVSRP